MQAAEPIQHLRIGQAAIELGQGRLGSLEQLQVDNRREPKFRSGAVLDRLPRLLYKSGRRERPGSSVGRATD
jgi:hypothetical protein